MNLFFLLLLSLIELSIKKLWIGTLISISKGEALISSRIEMCYHTKYKDKLTAPSIWRRACLFVAIVILFWLVQILIRSVSDQLAMSAVNKKEIRCSNIQNKCLLKFWQKRFFFLLLYFRDDKNSKIFSVFIKKNCNKRTWKSAIT